MLLKNFGDHAQAMGNSIKMYDKGGSILQSGLGLATIPCQVGRRDHMTTKGREIVTAILQAQHATLQQLNALAA